MAANEGEGMIVKPCDVARSTKGFDEVPRPCEVPHDAPSSSSGSGKDTFAIPPRVRNGGKEQKVLCFDAALPRSSPDLDFPA